MPRGNLKSLHYFQNPKEINAILCKLHELKNNAMTYPITLTVNDVM